MFFNPNSLSLFVIKGPFSKLRLLIEKRFAAMEVPDVKLLILRKLWRIVGQQMLLENKRDDQERGGQEGAHRAPQPGPERQRDEHRERIQGEPPADDGGCDEMTFEKS